MHCVVDGLNFLSISLHCLIVSAASVVVLVLNYRVAQKICHWTPLVRNTRIKTPMTILRPFFRDHPGQPVSEENFFWTFMMQGLITEADTSTIWLGATPAGLISSPPPSSPIFTPDALPAATLPLYSWDRHQICWLAYPVEWFH